MDAATPNGDATPAGFLMRPIGVVRNSRTELIDDGWDLIDSRIELDLSMLDESATDGLMDFSHVEVAFVFHRVDEADIERGARHPRGNPDWPKVGILAQRPKMRPNRIGTTVCELMRVRPGGVVEVRGLDAVDGTPVLDVKPYMAEIAPRGDVRQPAWSHELMTAYWTDPDVATRLDDATAAAWLEEIGRSPADVGTLDLVVRRPATGEREVLDRGELDVTVGLVGDNWLPRGDRSRPDGSAHPDAQLNVMNVRCASLVAAGDRARIPLAGDQLYVDFDLSPANVPPGTRLAVGSAVIEITAKPHTGCAKFTQRFGLAAHRFINGRAGRSRNLRGVCAKVVVPGLVAPGDEVRKL